MENLLLADEIVCVASIFALGFFCAILPRTRIARYFYILFGITILPVGIKSILDGIHGMNLSGYSCLESLRVLLESDFSQRTVQ